MDTARHTLAALALLCLAAPAHAQQNNTGGQLQYGEVQYGALQYVPPQYGAVQYAPVQYGETQYGPLQYQPAQYVAPQYGALQYAAPQYAPLQYGAVDYGRPREPAQAAAAPAPAHNPQCDEPANRSTVACAPTPAATTGTQFDDGYDAQTHTRFEALLAPHGRWVDAPDYGRVWVPSAALVGADFAPYSTSGHWAHTEAGWTWVSSFAWGWAPFHYGRWVRAPHLGWSWVPGSVWGPAWVSWRRAEGAIGWAPLPPVGLSGASFDNRLASMWRFVASANMGQARVQPLAAEQTTSLLSRATVADRPVEVSVGDAVEYVNAGPLVEGAEAVTLASLGARVLPHAEITPREGDALSERPWVREGAPGSAGNVMIGTQPVVGTEVHPSYMRPAEASAGLVEPAAEPETQTPRVATPQRATGSRAGATTATRRGTR